MMALAAFVTPVPEKEEARIRDLCESAFTAEFYRNFPQAYHIHGNAVVELTAMSKNAGMWNDERRRIARKQLKFHEGRCTTLLPYLQNTAQSVFIPLPSALTASQDLAQLRYGWPSLSQDEIQLTRYRNSHNPAEKAAIEPSIRHLLMGPKPPPISPSLDLTAPPITYHVYVKREPMTFGYFWYYFKVKDASESQTLYILQVYNRMGYQIASTILSRASAFTSPCVAVTIEGIPQKDFFNSGSADAVKARAMRFQTPSGRIIEEIPDRNLKPGWQPRRFTYGGREFAWKKNSKSSNPMRPEELIEVEGSWPKPGSKTGKKEDRPVGPPIFWGGKVPLTSAMIAKLHIAPGVDQLFREYIIASQLSRLAVMMYGHHSSNFHL